MKRQCITPCTGSDCLDCTQLSYATGDPATTVDTAVGGFVGGPAVKKLYDVTSTNYAELSKYQCACSTGYVWDKYRLSCLSELLIAIAWFRWSFIIIILNKLKEWVSIDNIITMIFPY